MLRAVLSIALLGFSFLAFAAENAFVIDKLLVGVHKDADLNSAIVKVLPTGTELEILSRKGELAEVKDADGVSGWVDAAYLMKDPPAASVIEQVQQEKKLLADRLKELEAKAAGGDKPGSAIAAKVDALTNENTDLKSQLSAQKLRNSELEDQVKTLRKSGAAAAGGSVAAELQSANLAMKGELDQALRRSAELEAKLGTGSALGEIKSAAVLSSPVIIGGITVIVVLAFGAGIYLMDFLSRRRHGGFRI